MRPIIVATAMDEGFALPTSVMLTSLVENLGAGVELDVFVVADRVTEPTRRRIEAGISRDSVTLRWIAPDPSVVADVPPGANHPAIYFRLLLPELLPQNVDRIIYLDGDLVVRGDIAELWQLDMAGHLALAVPDAYARLLHLSRLTRLRIEELPTFDTDAPYFNSGVMLIDLAGWREHSIGERALRWARAYPRQLLYYDQDALNCALHGRWGRLDVAWNFHEIPRSTRVWEAEQYGRDELRRAFREPKIVHFTAQPKPWRPYCDSVHSRLFFEYLQLTPWKGWRLPATPKARRWRWSLFHRPHMRFEWHLWRGARSRDVLLLWRALAVLVRHPWMVVTYPLFRAPRIPAILKDAAHRLLSAPVAGPVETIG